MTGPPKGIEARLIKQAQTAFAGESVDPAAGQSFTQLGLSPNQRALALAVGYAVHEGPLLTNVRSSLLAWFRDQATAFMRREPAGYRGYFEVAMALVVRIAWQRRDEEIYRHVLRWWMTYVALCGRCSVATGEVYIPGPRQGQPHHEGPWVEARDWNFLILQGAVVINPRGIYTEPFIATSMLQQLSDAGEIPVLPAPNDRYLPNLRDPLRIQRWPEGLCVEVETFWPDGWPEGSIPPIEGAPFWSCVVTSQGDVIDAVSWRTVAEIRSEAWTWQQVAHANIAGYKAPRPPYIPAAWGEPTYDVLLGDAGSIPPLPPLPANWPTAPAPPPEEDPGPSDEEIRGWSTVKLFHAPPAEWGGVFRQAWNKPAWAAIAAADKAERARRILAETLIAEMHRKPELRKGLRRPDR